jgi:hypothetical protein
VAPVAVVSQTVKVGKSVSFTAVAKQHSVSVPKSAVVKVVVSSKSAKLCKVIGKSVKALKKGACRVTITVTPKKGRKVTKTVSIVVS